MMTPMTNDTNEMTNPATARPFPFRFILFALESPMLENIIPSIEKKNDNTKPAIANPLLLVVS